MRRSPAPRSRILCGVERTLGFERFVIVHAHALRRGLPPCHRQPRSDGRPQPRPRHRPHRRQHQRPARSNGCMLLAFAARASACRDDLPGPPNFDMIMRTADRIRGLGWHLRLHFRPRRRARRVPIGSTTLRRHPRSRSTISAMSIPRSAPPSRPCRWLVDKLKDSDNWWLMLSNGNRLSAMEQGYDDAIPIARAYIEAAPERVIWGYRLAACAVAQAAHDERRRGGGAALSLCR